jgi:hypothetical protein
VHAVPPKEIGCGSFATMSPLSISLMLSLSEKASALRTIHQSQASRCCTQHQCHEVLHLE